MKFYTEEIPDEDRAKIDWNKFKESRVAPRARWWTINAERDSFFLCLRHSMPEIPFSTFLFDWKGFVLIMEAIVDFKRTNILRENGIHECDDYWKILRIFFPKELLEQKATVLADLEAAIKCGGDISNRIDTHSKTFITYSPEFKLALVDQPPENRTGLKISSPSA